MSQENKQTTYFVLLAGVLIVNSALSFYYADVSRNNHNTLMSMMEFKSKGARYTYEDGVKDRADRDRMIAELSERIEAMTSTHVDVRGTPARW
jgi:hypothetical protein